MNTLRRTSFTTIGLTVAACGVSNADPSLWQQSKDLGGAMYSPMPGAAGEPQGSGGNPNTPPGSGGVTEGTGNAPPVGGSSQTQGSGGTTGMPFGNGGVTQGVGGSTTSFGGTPPGSGGMPFGAGGSMIGAGGSMMGTGGSTMPSGNSGKCTFKFDVTTVTARGLYAPANVGAIWITDSSNKFVKTLSVWGTIRLSNATAWVQSSNNNRTDAVTAATRHSHGALSATWNCTNASEATVPDGMYTVNVTFTESDSIPFFGGTTPTATVKFTKGTAGDDQKGTDTANFTGMHATIMPAP